ncbi:hypothetical protein [Pontibacter litorisediminis]|uniref:hypothetical protein n=1 Tax=Pontibacter litorisediminis TaxID=1846260 RepID=UPI0023EBB20B|nr:hypothetical protein [Pontibacter litorisediminis]
MLTAVLVLLASVLAFNVALKAEYNKGTFRDEYKDYTTLDLKGFNAISVNGASSVRVEVVPGDYKVRVLDRAEKYIKMDVRGQELVLDVAFPEEYSMPNAVAHVIIACPDLKALKADARYSAAGEAVVEKAYEGWPSSTNGVTVKEMKLDSLTIEQDNGSLVALAGNSINNLQATTGLSEGSSPRLTIARGNNIRSAQLNIGSGSELVLEDVAIPSLSYSFSDSAKAVLSGASLAMMKK